MRVPQRCAHGSHGRLAGDAYVDCVSKLDCVPETAYVPRVCNAGVVPAHQSGITAAQREVKFETRDSFARARRHAQISTTSTSTNSYATGIDITARAADTGVCTSVAELRVKHAHLRPKQLSGEAVEPHVQLVHIHNAATLFIRQRARGYLVGTVARRAVPLRRLIS